MSTIESRRTARTALRAKTPCWAALSRMNVETSKEYIHVLRSDARGLVINARDLFAAFYVELSRFSTVGSSAYATFSCREMTSHQMYGLAKVLFKGVHSPHGVLVPSELSRKMKDRSWEQNASMTLTVDWFVEQLRHTVQNTSGVTTTYKST